MNLENSKLVSQNLDFSSFSCVPQPKFKKRKVSCLRDFPMGFCQLGREIKQKLDEGTEEKRSSLMRSTKSLPKRRKVSAVRDFPDAFLQLNGAEEFSRKIVIEDEYDKNDMGSDLEDDIEPSENDVEAPKSPADMEFDHLSHKEESPEASHIDRLGIQEYGFGKVIGSVKNAGGQGSGTKFFRGHNSGSEELECRIIVQALMAAPRCPWRPQAKRGGSKKRKMLQCIVASTM